jgi:predicted nucleic acid-binding protein
VALLDGKARRIFFETDLQEFAVPETVVREVQAHLPLVSLRIGAPRAFLEYALELLPLTRYPASAYRQTIQEAKRRIWERDPDDVDVLALSLRLALPVWTNDRDFEAAGIASFTTARLLAVFFGSPSR